MTMLRRCGESLCAEETLGERTAPLRITTAGIHAAMMQLFHLSNSTGRFTGGFRLPSKSITRGMVGPGGHREGIRAHPGRSDAARTQPADARPDWETLPLLACVAAASSDTAIEPHPAPIGSMSLQPGIPWRVALPRSPPPLPRPWTSRQYRRWKPQPFFQRTATCPLFAGLTERPHSAQPGVDG